jgi:hypothetical protein
MSPKSLALEQSGMYRRQWLELLSSEKLEGRKCIVCVFVCLCVYVWICVGAEAGESEAVKEIIGFRLQ